MNFLFRNILSDWMYPSRSLSLYHIFILIRMVPFPLHFRSFISLFLPLSIEFSFTLVKRIRIFVMLNPLVSKFNLIQTGGGAFRTPLRQNRDNSYTKRAMTFKFSDFSQIYLGTFWYNYHVHVINHVAMATSF